MLIIPLYVGANPPPSPGELVEELEDAFKGIKWRFVRIPVRADSIGLEVYLWQTIYENNEKYNDIRIVYQAKDWMFIKSGRSLILLVDGERVALSGAGSIEARWVTEWGICEEALYPVSAGLIGKLSMARDISLKVYGHDREIEAWLPEHSTRYIRAYQAEVLDN